ncbi:MAG: hypothetical protein WDM71_08825 [Ferruginibacter sp.]
MGNYIRSLVPILAEQYPANHYTLFAPKQTDLFDISAFNNVSVITPTNYIDKKFPSFWRSSRMVKDIAAARMDIYHGVSNELPAGIENISVKKVVTVHDIIMNVIRKRIILMSFMYIAGK